MTCARFIYVTGCDGTGKSTQANLLLAYLEEQGIRPKHLWLRFPFFLTLPFLVYARLRGYSWYEEQDGIRQGYWDFRHSRLLRNLLPWVLLIDATFAAIGRVYLPLWLGRTLVCERFVLDMLVDLSIALGEPNFHSRLPGRWYLHLLPRDAAIIILDLDADTLRARRTDLRMDKHLEARLAGFRRLVEAQALNFLSSQESIETIRKKIQKMIRSHRE